MRPSRGKWGISKLTAGTFATFQSANTWCKRRNRLVYYSQQNGQNGMKAANTASDLTHAYSQTSSNTVGIYAYHSQRRNWRQSQAIGYRNQMMHFVPVASDSSVNHSADQHSPTRRSGKTMSRRVATTNVYGL